MTNLADLREDRAPHSVLTAALSALLPIGVVAYVVWKDLEQGRETIYRDDFGSWVLIVCAASVVAAAIGMWFWKGTRVRLALMGGIALAAVACVLGILVEIMVNTT